jgi:hypothetical protein
MAKDKYWQASQNALRATDYELARVQSDLNSYVAAGDKESAAVAVSELANLARQRENITLLRQQYAASKQGPAPLTDEERFHKPLEKMDYNDALALARTSRYGRNLTHNDPAVRSGYAEVARRRAAEGKR